jgi:hypothetical protein
MSGLWRVGPENKAGQNGEGGKRESRKVFPIFFKNDQTHEFKHEFEFNH